MYIDFDINNYNTVQEYIDDVVYDNNYLSPSYALNYKSFLCLLFMDKFNRDI